MQKYIFLDMDGVLNSIEYSLGMDNMEKPRRFLTNDADTVKIGLLRFLCKQTDAKIVISSTWRYGKDVGWFIGYFERAGWPRPPVVGLTPIHGNIRGDEIQAWLLGRHGTDSPFSYVILDDDRDFHDGQPLIHVDRCCGLSLKNIIEAIDILGLGSEAEPNEINSLRKHVDVKPKKGDN